MKRAQTMGLSVVTAFALAACGHSAPPAGQDLAARACKSSGSEAAQIASQAAAANPRFATLATDEAALAATEAQTQAELSDGSDTSGVVGAEGLGTPGSITVITDCTRLGLPVH
ncbi:MAG: hypothetical protein JO246_00540 [Frankiaceae bacterium]|nr:hypothetical protein [Frankiaceae bacterium]MBV9869602.1 hypothetical protein [Frankiaceae bacterium]